MSTRALFPRTRSTLAAATLVLTLAVSNPAAAENLVLAGPHPMLKENALALHLVTANGFGDSFSGRGFSLEYGYMLQKPLWLDFQTTYRAPACGLLRSCSMYTGTTVEVLVGLQWRFQTDIPLVPYVRGAGGLVFLYPDHFQNAMGVAVRGGGGLRYYLYDWLGFGFELGVTLGDPNFAEGYGGSTTHFVGDLSGSVEYQF